MAEVFFYHLTAQPLKTVLPQLVAKGMERALRMVVETSVPDNLASLSEMLWAAEDLSFIAHGLGEDDATQQPLWLCAGPENPNAATVRFYLDGAMPQSLEGLMRAVIMFQGEDEQALISARNEWKKRKTEGHAISYWKQDEGGKWRNLA